MTNREKVIKGLECCNSTLCQKCPYNEKKECNNRGFFYSQAIEDALALLKERETVVRCKDCKHLFDGEHTKNCCDALMEKAGWLKEISVSPDWFCADGKRR